MPASPSSFSASPAFKIESSGDATFSEAVSANQFIATSDKRLKKNIKELDKEEIENNFNNLNSVKFKWKKHAKNNADNPHSYNYGLIAQNVKECFPNCVFEKKDGFYGVDYSGLVSILISKVQSQGELLEKKDEQISTMEKNMKKQSIVLDNLIERMENMEKTNIFHNKVKRFDDFDRLP